MKKYIRSRIFMTIKACIAIIIIFFIGKENYENKSLSVSMNTNLNKSIDKQIIYSCLILIITILIVAVHNM